ncbi:MAG: DUF4267 domain-containing protein [Hyphomicrobium sp.]
MTLRWIRAIAFLAGLLLAAIGIRFLIAPDRAAHTFGLAKDIAGFELHQVIGLRDLWLGALAMAFAALKEWRALALWFGFGAIVCFADAGIAAASSGRPEPVAFHVVCGFACAALATWLARYPRLS